MVEELPQIMHIALISEAMARSALPQVGDEVPDVAVDALRGAWEATQQLLAERRISAGHDISDGGLAVALLEMAFAGNTGVEVSIGIQHPLHLAAGCCRSVPSRCCR